MSFGSRLSKLRKEKGKLQADVAKDLGFARATYGAYEQDKRQPDFEALKKISTYFDVTIDFLLTGNNSVNSPDEMWKELLDPDKQVFFKDLLDAPEEKIEELIRFWEFIKERDKNK
jgi:transcriptional regulator with XRE-family HTH domain